MDLFRQALKQLRARGIESILIVAAVAVGVGVVTATAAFLDYGRQVEARFSASLVARELSIQPLSRAPVAVSERNQPLVLRLGDAERPPPEFTLADLDRALEAVPTLTSAYAYRPHPFVYQTQGIAERLTFKEVTSGFITAAEVHLRVGALFSAEDFERGNQVLIITPTTARLLDALDDPVGQVVQNEDPWRRGAYTIIGVLADEDAGVFAGYVPYQHSGRVDALYFTVDDLSLIPQARAELQAFANRRWGESVVVTSPALHGHLTAERRRAAWLTAVFATSGLVVASLNIMNLILTRVYQRSCQLAISRTVGATRGAIGRQILAEAGLLGLLGGGLGIAAGYGLLAAYNSYLQAATEGVQLGLALSPLAVTIAAILSISVVVLFGLYPAIVAARLNVVDALRDSLMVSKAVPRTRLLRRAPLRTALVSLQVMLAALLLTLASAAFLSGHSVRDEQELFSIRFANVGRQVISSLSVFDEAMLAELPSLTSAVQSFALFRTERYRQIVANSQRYVLTLSAVVSPSFFETAGIALVRGSFFTEQDVRQGQNLVVLEEEVARYVFDAEDPVGQTVTLMPNDPDLASRVRGMEPVDYQVVGTFRDNAKWRAGSHVSSRKAAYFSPRAGLTYQAYSHLLVQAFPGQASEAREQTLAAARWVYEENEATPERLTRSFSATELERMDFVVEDPDNPLKLFRTVDPNLLLLSLFGIAALIIASVGVFSGAVVEVAERSKEIGVRRALGASREVIAVSMVFERGVFTLLGGFVGVAGAALLLPGAQRWTDGELLRGSAVNVEPLTGLAVVGLLLVVGVVLSLVPLLRAFRIKPAEALREG